MASKICRLERASRGWEKHFQEWCLKGCFAGRLWHGEPQSDKKKMHIIHIIHYNQNTLPSAHRICEIHVTYFCGDVYFCWVRYIAAYWKSSNTFCLLPKQPAWCHVSPYSLGRKTKRITVRFGTHQGTGPGNKSLLSYIKVGPLVALGSGRGIIPFYVAFTQRD